MPPAGEMEQVEGKMKKPQDQNSLTSHFFVCKVFWDRRGGHSQPMVLLGILKEIRERSGGIEREMEDQPDLRSRLRVC